MLSDRSKDRLFLIELTSLVAATWQGVCNCVVQAACLFLLGLNRYTSGTIRMSYASSSTLWNTCYLISNTFQKRNLKANGARVLLYGRGTRHDYSDNILIDMDMQAFPIERIRNFSISKRDILCLRLLHCFGS